MVGIMVAVGENIAIKRVIPYWLSGYNLRNTSEPQFLASGELKTQLINGLFEGPQTQFMNP